MLRVLQISPFAIPDSPDSGGLIRIAETRRAYERAGCEVSTCCLVTKPRDLRNPLDLQLTWMDRLRRPHIGKPSNLGPIRIRWATLKSSRLLEQLLGKIKQPFDVIHIEHPWAIQLATNLRKHPECRDALLVYGSHNIEHQLYRGLWEKQQLWNRNAQRLYEHIKATEVECAKHADLCWAVSEQDAHVLRDTLRAKHVVLAPSGCREFPAKAPIPGLPDCPYVIFVGGAYSPNVDGFVEWCGNTLTYLPANTAIVIAGAAGDVIANKPQYHTDLTRGALINFGKTPQNLLDQLILHASAVILPISTGGGTNLKTAEALRSQRPLVATEASMRGFEDWNGESGVHIATTPRDFQQMIVNHLSNEANHDWQRRNVDYLGWQCCLKDAIDTTLALEREKSGKIFQNRVNK